MSEERRTIKNWGARLSAADEPLTLTEAQAFATMSTSDLLLEIRNALQDIQCRLTRLEIFVGSTVPDYDARTRRLAMAAAQNGSGS